MESSTTSPATPSQAQPSSGFRALATVTGNLYLVFGTSLFSTLTLLVSWLPLRPRSAAVSWISRTWSSGILKTSWLRVRVEGGDALDPQASYVFLANHQSLFDIPALLATSPCPMRMMAKRSLFRIPLFGWSMAAGGFIPIDRGGDGGRGGGSGADGSSARQSFSTAVARLQKGTSILLFPEGTRSFTDVLLPFQRGGFLLAMKTGLPIVPVGVRGTRAVQRKDSFAIHPGRIEVRYGAPIDIAAYGVRRKKELIAEVRARIAELAGLDAGGEAEA
jgi:1-acyl-sn-glycerol-3-phosphate acyltransferase